MTADVNFDELAQKVFAPTATSEDNERLFAAVFSLESWYFIADEEFQRKVPYCSPFPNLFGDAIVLTVFTDRERARKFIAEGGVKGKAAENSAPEDLIMNISATGILDFLDQMATLGVVKIFFNPDKDSHGFHHDLKMMRPIYEHLENKGLLTKNEPKMSIENASPELAKLLEENADVIAEFDRENEMLSAIFAGTAAAMDEADAEDKERIISDTADMFKSFQAEYNMSPKLFKIYIESCLNQRKLLMPTLAFAYFQQTESGIKRLERDKELSDDLARWLIRKAVPNADLLMNEPPQNSAVPDNDFSANKNNERNSAESAVDFDELSRKAMETNAMEDLNALFGAAFTLEKWMFISRGELPDIYPYIASNPAAADNQPMIRAFTDAERLMRFARENNLTDADGSCKMLTIPTENIVPYLEGFVEQGAFGVWFNSDSESKDFFIPLKQLQPIKDHLAKLNPPAETKFTALILTITDGLMFPSGAVSKSSYQCNFFCWIPLDWTENLQLKPEYLEKLYEQFYGAGWRSGNSDGSRYVVLEANSAAISPERVKDTQWNLTQNTELNHYWHYIGESGGVFRKVSADEFQAYLNAYFQSQKRNETRKQQDNLANFGVSETADSGFDQNLRLNTYGSVNIDASIRPFYAAIVHLLENYQGTGDFVTLMRYEPSGISELVEGIEKNAHGDYLQIRRFYYLNPKNNTRIGVNNIHSRTLRHVETNASLTVSLELCKLMDEPVGAIFYHCFEGPREIVLKLQAAIQPVLESLNYKEG